MKESNACTIQHEEIEKLHSAQPGKKPSLADMIADAERRAPGYGSSATGGPDDLLPDLGYPTARPEKDRE